MKDSYLCIVNEIRRNLRPNWATKIAKRAGTCFLGKSYFYNHNCLTIKTRLNYGIEGKGSRTKD